MSLPHLAFMPRKTAQGVVTHAGRALWGDGAGAMVVALSPSNVGAAGRAVGGGVGGSTGFRANSR